MWLRLPWGHMSHPPDLCSFCPLESLHYFTVILPAGDSLLWNYRSPIQVSYAREKCHLDQPERKLTRHLSCQGRWL